MRRGLDVAAVLVVFGVVLYLIFNGRNPGPAPGAPANPTPAAVQSGRSPSVSGVSSSVAESNSPKTAASESQTQPESLADKAGQLITEASPATPLPAETALQNVKRAVHKYGEMFGGNPVGTNPEIASELSGNNPKHMNFITEEAGMRVNGDGELVDSWGTPYFFHQISGAEMEIHSAGPDKVMWTADDLVLK